MITFLSKRGISAALAVLLAGQVGAQDIAAPSGITMRLYDVRLEQDPPIARFRLVSPAVDPAGEGRTFGDLVDDLQHVCDHVVVPSLAANNWTGTSVVISVSNVETEFGIYDDGVTQFFQPYQIADNTCMWEDF